jgi:hypothetical protein
MRELLYQFGIACGCITFIIFLTATLQGKLMFVYGLFALVLVSVFLVKLLYKLMLWQDKEQKKSI